MINTGTKPGQYSLVCEIFGFRIYFAIPPNIGNTSGSIGVGPPIRGYAHVVMLVATWRKIFFSHHAHRLEHQCMFGIAYQLIKSYCINPVFFFNPLLAFCQLIEVHGDKIGKGYFLLGKKGNYKEHEYP